MSERPTRVMRRRLNIWLMVPITALLVYIVISIFNVSVRDGKKWQSLANSQQLKSTSVSASRGTIYDRNGTVLAQSATVYTVYVDPKMLEEQLKQKDERIKELKDLVATEEDESKRIDYQQKLDEAISGDDSLDELVEFLSLLLEIDTKQMRDDLTDTSTQYIVLKKDVEKTMADKIEDKLTELDLDGVRCDPTTKRLYPQNSLAANVLGHTDYDGNGIYGLEAYYDDYLAGVDGRIITAKANDGTEIPYRYKQSYEAQDGDNLNLNIDANIQYILEKELQEAYEKNMPTDRICGIIMNPKTAQVYAMATCYSYDPNTPAHITNDETAAELSLLDESSDEYHEKALDEWSVQWKNKAISETYNPGSVFKVIVGASALEEKAISLDDKFSCNTVIQVEDTPFHCWSDNDHGSQDLALAMLNSCNPVFVQIGLKLGAVKFDQYFSAFGFRELTGIDLPGEVNSINIMLQDYGPVELGSSSFGQTNKVTPIQMITAYAACINGGYLMEPQIVNSITDSNGNVVKNMEPVVKRQVISEETSANMRDILEGVVEGQPGSNCYIKGYRIGGKSGTSQKLDEDRKGETYVSSYCAFAPADDPEIIMLVMVDHPTGEKFYGSQVAAPICVDVLSEVLPYMGFFPEYTEAELAELQINVPSVEYYQISEAKKTLKDLGLEVKVVGSGNTVIKQVPHSVKVESGGSVVLYTDEQYKLETVTVPELKGLTKDQAKQTLESYGLNLTAEGAGYEEEGAVAQEDQSVEAGKSVPMGTAITVSFDTVKVGSQ
ncbi:MAG: PASTA domain-containing protein [Ruminococcus sp.]|nr:PASTA domain-containing protein [Ruminococcus sp.]